jgi:hypothetical protein
MKNLIVGRMNWYYILGFMGLIMVFKFITNLYKYNRVKSLYNEYLYYIRTDNLEFVQKKEEIKSLFKEAGLKDSSVIHQEFLGFGNFANMQVSVFDNLTNRREDIVGNVQMRFNEAIGVYKKRYKESFNPIFWIDFVVKFPQHLMEFFGILPEKITVKIFLVIYWILAILFGLTKINLLDYLFK